MSAVLETHGLGKRYGRRFALRDCTLSIPDGKVVGLVGPNGAGKTTLLQLAVGLLRPTQGSIEVLGGRPGDGAAQLERVGFVAQDTPTYAGLSVAKHLRMGRISIRAGIGSWQSTEWTNSGSTLARGLTHCQAASDERWRPRSDTRGGDGLRGGWLARAARCG